MVPSSSLLCLLMVMTSTNTEGDKPLGPESLSSHITPAPQSLVHMGLVVGSSAGVNIAWQFHPRFQWDNSWAWIIDKQGGWLGTSDLLFLFPDAIGPTGSDGRLVLYTGLGYQMDYVYDDDRELRYGSRVTFGIKYIFANQRYEAFSAVATGLYYAPELRASLDTSIGLRLNIW